jgi:hypothetical protein
VIANPTDIGIVFTGGIDKVEANIFGSGEINGTAASMELDNFGTVPSQGTSVPEPGVLLLLGADLFGVCVFSKIKMADQ